MMPFSAIQYEGSFDLTKDYERYVLLEQPKIVEWYKEGQKFYCPFCGCKFILVNGTQTITHFRHKTKCIYHTEPETEEHLSMKKWVYETIPLHNPVKFKRIEHKIGHNIADVYFELCSGQKIAVECQCSSISLTEVIQRTENYNSKNIYVLWILGTRNFLKVKQTINQCGAGRSGIECDVSIGYYCSHLAEIQQSNSFIDSYGVEILDKSHIEVNYICDFLTIDSIISTKQIERWLCKKYRRGIHYYYDREQIKVELAFRHPYNFSDVQITVESIELNSFRKLKNNKLVFGNYQHHRTKYEFNLFENEGYLLASFCGKE